MSCCRAQRFERCARKSWKTMQTCIQVENTTRGILSLHSVRRFMPSTVPLHSGCFLPQLREARCRRGSKWLATTVWRKSDRNKVQITFDGESRRTMSMCSQSMSTPVASMHVLAALTISGPIPSPTVESKQDSETRVSRQSQRQIGEQSGEEYDLAGEAAKQQRSLLKSRALATWRCAASLPVDCRLLTTAAELSTRRSMSLCLIDRSHADRMISV